MSACGSFTAACRAAPDGQNNVKTSFSLVGADAGYFTRSYDLYAPDDIYCNQELVGSYHLTGTFAMHGPSNCSGSCSVRQDTQFT